jgi:hypothetical protein
VKTVLLVLVLLVTVTAAVVWARVYDRPATDRGVPNGCIEWRSQDATGLSCGPVQLDDGLV